MNDIRLEQIEKRLDKIMDNELVHLKDDIDELKECMNKIDIRTEKHGVDLEWIKKFFWIVATASVGSLVAAVLGLILK